tara:strand:- start:63 stop:515 length:453 start_codon:yes stop_codon:yes gene_type:complete
LNKLEKDIEYSKKLLIQLEQKGFNTSVADLKRHLNIAKKIPYEKQYDQYFKNEFETIHNRIKRLTKFKNYLKSERIRDKMDFDLTQIKNLRHDIKNKLIEQSQALIEVENEKNAILPYLSNFNNNINSILLLLETHDSVETHMQLLWDNW